MSYSPKANNLINIIHEKSIGIVSGDNENNIERLFEKVKRLQLIKDICKY